jgi:fatty acid desaturase
MWYIDGKKYDFTNFKHPGGPIAISLAKDRDSTLLFKSYHPFSPHIDQIIKKYEVVEKDTSDEASEPSQQSSSILRSSESTKKSTDLFAWDGKETEFMRDLKSQVYPILKRTGMKANTERWLHILLLALLNLAMLIPFVKGYWWSIVALPLSNWLFSVNTYHDASHMALSHNWKINMFFTYLTPWFSSPFLWYHQHVIGHHVYTNLKEDPDLHHGRYVWRYHPKMRWFKWYKWQMYYLVLVWSIIVASLAFLIDFIAVVNKSYHRVIPMMKISKRREIIHWAGRIVTFAIVFVWPYFHPEFSWLKAYLWSVVPYVIYSCCFAFCSQLNHLTEHNVDQYDRDWYRHQVMTSHTFAPNSLFWFFFTGGLNLQVEHHLFPGVNHWHLRKIHSVVKACCKKHNVPYFMSETAGEALRKHLNLLSKLSKKPAKIEPSKEQIVAG